MFRSIIGAYLVLYSLALGFLLQKSILVTEINFTLAIAAGFVPVALVASYLFGKKLHWGYCCIAVLCVAPPIFEIGKFAVVGEQLTIAMYVIAVPMLYLVGWVYFQVVKGNQVTG